MQMLFVQARGDKVLVIAFMTICLQLLRGGLHFLSQGSLLSSDQTFDQKKDVDKLIQKQLCGACHNGLDELTPYAIKEALHDASETYRILQNTSKYEVLSCSYGLWHAYTIGPLYTAGGYSWTSVSAFFADDLEIYGGNDFLAVDKYILGNIDATKKMLGYPPIHQHHFHWFDNGDPQGFGGQHSYHGDWQCTRDEGGIGCALNSAPPGYAFFLRKRIGLWNEFNDVRPTGSPTLESAILVSFKVVDNAASVRQVFSDTLGTGGPFSDTLGPGGINPTGMRVTYDVPTRVESLIWSQTKLPEGVSQVFSAIGHSHMEDVADIMLFQGQPEQVFSDLPGVRMALNSLQHRVGIVEQTLQNIKQRQTLPNAAYWACSFIRDMHLEDGGRFSRASKCSINASIPDVVVVALHRKRFPDTPEHVAMHALWFITFARTWDGIWLRPDTGLPLSDYIELARFNQNWTLSPVWRFTGPLERVR